MGKDINHTDSNKGTTSQVVDRPERFTSPHPSVISRALEDSKEIQLPAFAYQHAVGSAESAAAFGQHGKAIEDYKTAFAIKAVESFAKDHCGMGESHLALGESDDAIASFKKALSKEPTHIASHKGLITSYHLMKSRLSPEDKFTTAILNQIIRPLSTKLEMLEEAAKEKGNSLEKQKPAEAIKDQQHETVGNKRPRPSTMVERILFKRQKTDINNEHQHGLS